jgi:hypothetical protein
MMIPQLMIRMTEQPMQVMLVMQAIQAIQAVNQTRLAQKKPATIEVLAGFLTLKPCVVNSPS